MKIIILRDYKGFQKEVVVPRFPHDYRVVEFKPLSAVSKEEVVLADSSSGHKELIFYPNPRPDLEGEVTVWTYKQIN